jgi:glyoxylase-like metal-dependent hydrolase (beta-lactamase superfamily II)
MAITDASRGPGTASEIADGIYAIDTGFRGQAGAVGAFLVVGPEGLGLVETGPTTVQANLLAGIRDAGHEIGDVRDVVVTHIHLDHAGGLGTLMRDQPQVRAWVHPVGLPHMLRPEKLIASATRIYGDQMDTLWGAFLPVPEDRVQPTEEGTPISLGGRAVVPWDTPGHASHHVALLDEQTGTLFTGDVAGVRMQGTTFPVPPLPPPDIDIAAWKRSIARMRELAPERLALTHFSVYDDVERHLDMLEHGLDATMAIGREVLIPGGTDAELTARLEAWQRAGLGDDADRVAPALDAANPLYMSASGIHRVLRKAGELEA